MGSAIPVQHQFQTRRVGNSEARHIALHHQLCGVCQSVVPSADMQAAFRVLIMCQLELLFLHSPPYDRLMPQ